MYKRIVVPLDGSGLAEQVLPYVCFVAKYQQAQVELLRVVDEAPAHLLHPRYGLTGSQVWQAMLSESQDYLCQVQSGLECVGLTVSGTVLAGVPAARIVAHADMEEDTLIAMTTHGRSGIGRWAMGSVTDKVLRASRSPLLMVRSKAPAEIKQEVELKQIILPLDGSRFAEQALSHAVTLAGPRNLPVLLTGVTPMVGDYGNYMAYSLNVPSSANPHETWLAHDEAAAKKYLHGVRERLLLHGVQSVEKRVLSGRPADAIVDLARETPYSVVVMTTHGRSGIGRWLLGSVADKVMRGSGSPVLVVRPGEEQCLEPWA